MGAKRRGQIVTFYSYKGGTGRSMAVANVAWILASSGRRVLAIDWDLEAPGLHRYFQPFLIDHDLRASPGVIDLMWDYAVAVMDPGRAGDDPLKRYRQISRYATSIDYSFPDSGLLDLVPAGQQDVDYAERAAAFDWRAFYERQGGGALIDALRKQAVSEYDYVLIDSRTGLADSVGICTVHLPDLLVNCLTLSGQNIDGGLAVAQSALEQRAGRPLRVMPVLMRVEDAETPKLEVGRDYVRRRFGPVLSWLPPDKRDRYWADMEVPYKPFYAYEEILAAVGDRAVQENTLLAALERVTSQITGGAVSALAPVPEEERRRLLASFERRLFVADEIYIVAAREDAAWRDWISWVFSSQGYQVATAEDRLRVGGDVATELTSLLASAAAVVVVVSPALADSADWRQITEAIARRDPGGAQRLVIPVIVSSVPTGLLDTRLGVDLTRRSADEAYDLLTNVARELQVPQAAGESPARTRTWYPGDEVMRVILRVTADQCVVIGPTGEERARGRVDVSGSPDIGLQIELGELHWARLTPAVAAERDGDAEDDRIALATRRAGVALGRHYLPGSVARVLRELIATGAAGNRLVLVGIETASELNDLPWEALVLPGEDRPLALDGNVALYRHLPGPGSFSRKVRGPLRVLVAVGSPELADGRLLDYEAELAQIDAAVEPARRRGQVEVRVLNEGTLAAIRTALTEEPEGFHILHLSCHAEPGELILEDADGKPDVVTADRLLAEAVPTGKGLPMVVLSGCSTGLAARRARRALYAVAPVRGATSNIAPQEATLWSFTAPVGQDPADQPGAEREPPGEIVPASFAVQLAHAGIAQVLAMQAVVSDAYATRFGGEYYRYLTSDASADPLLALAEARRAVERDRASRRRASLPAEPAEWATPALFSLGQQLRLFDRRESTAETTTQPVDVILAEGMVRRPVGEFVGRRRQSREARRVLAGNQAGLVIHGIGGVGKSVLAAQVLTSLGADAGLVVSMTGPLTVDRLLAEVGRRLRQPSALTPPDKHSALAGAAIDRADMPWEDRWRLLAEQILPVVPMTILLDGFDANLEATPDGWQVRDPDLAALLSRWIRPGQSRFLFTTRYPFSLSRRTERLLSPLHLGPMTAGETWKLLRRLPGLDALASHEKETVYRVIGGHPRTLEFLDAFLRGGKARFFDIGLRMEDIARARGITDLDHWLYQPARDLDASLAEAVTLSAGDVLFSDLLDQVSATSLARQLVTGAAVYQVPVDDVALSFQVTEDGAALPAGGEERRSPVPAGLPAAIRTAEAAGLLVPVPLDGGAPAYLVHRWLARTIAELYPEATRDCHRRAAAFWHWRIAEAGRSGEQDTGLLLEARYHHHAAGETDQALEATELALPQLRTWGLYGYAAGLCRETLTWVAPDSPQAASFRRELGILVQAQGDYRTAETLYQQALKFFESANGIADVSRCLLRLGTLVQAQDDYEAADSHYRRAWDGFEVAGDRAGSGWCLLRLGTLAQARKMNDTAEPLFQQAQGLFESAPDRAGSSRSLFHLGTLAQMRGSHDAARDFYERSLTLAEELGDRAVITAVLYQFGTLAESDGAYEKAVSYYQRSLYICEELGDRAGEAQRASQLGALAARAGYPGAGIRLNLRAFAIRDQMGSQESQTDLRRLYRQREALGSVNFDRIAGQSGRLAWKAVRRPLGQVDPADADELLSFADPGVP